DRLEAWAPASALLTPMLAGLAEARRAQRAQAQLRAANRYFRDHQRRHYLFKELVTESEAMQEIYTRLSTYVEGTGPVLLVGEAGTGKELIARALHHLGSRNDGLMVAQNCAELDERVLDIVLFGGSGDGFGNRL